MAGRRGDVGGTVRAIVCAALVFWAPGALADDLYDRAFRTRIADYADPGALSQFTEAAVAAGQYDQAIATLEQILFQNPDDAGARLTLARLYYHVGSFDLALGHVNEALLLGLPSFEPALVALKARIERAQRPVRATLDVTAGGQVIHAETAYPSGFAPGTARTAVGGHTALDGQIVFDPDTASRDLVIVEGGLSIAHGFADADFDGRYEVFTAPAGYGAVTLSKGLPDLLPTLRADLSVFGDYRDLGGPRDLRQLGVRGRLGFRPTVETALYVEGSYAWLGASQALYADDHWSYGIGGEVRLAPGWTAAGFVRRYHRDGTVPGAILGGADFGYQVAGTEAGASLTHLVHVFDDGRGWFQQLSVRHADETILDYGAVAVARGSPVTARRSWQVDWDHSVQLSTDGWLQVGLGYRHDAIGPGGSNGRAEVWTGRVRYTHRFR